MAMSRPLRVEFEGAVYHVTARGNERKEIFRDDHDRLRFLETTGEACTRFGLVGLGFCLMPNHYHLLVQTPRGNLSQGLGWVQATWAARFNRRHHRSGHLVQGRFKAHLVDADAYARQLVRYVHLNPVRPRDRRKPVPPERREAFEAYRWSSHRAYAGTAAGGESPQWLSLEWLSYWQEAAGLGAGQARVRRAYRADLGSCFGEPAANPWAGLRGGLVLGGEELWEKAQALLGASPRRLETEWARRDTLEQARQRAAALAEGEPDRRVQLWLRAKLGGERRTDLAREFGYRDGSGVLQVVKRLETRSGTDKALARRVRQLRSAFDVPASSVQR
jgi:REP element-mobilizing transposase RayT